MVVGPMVALPQSTSGASGPVVGAGAGGGGGRCVRGVVGKGWPRVRHSALLAGNLKS